MKKRILTCFILFSLCTELASAQDSSATAASEPVDTKHLWHFSMTPSVGFTFQSISKDAEESEDLMWLGQLQAKLGYEGERFQLNNSLFLQYGARVSRESSPKKTQDNFMLSLVPSMTLSKKLGLRLFFEVTGETEMGEGLIDSQKTKFLDPLFLYETLFLGHKTRIASEDGGDEFEFVFGIGYAFQETRTSGFVLTENRSFVVNEGNPLENVQDQFTVEDGYSAILQLDYTKRIGENFAFKTSMKTVALTKENFIKAAKNSRVGTLLVAGLQYKFLSIDYTLHMLYDKNISLRRQLEQTMVFGLKFTI
ncbi:MAG: hypothetical protein Q8916_10020 [Bacteroidota bacterium]|nr:hypothetical protein [Bacteroidota bacterium]MDP4230724.1 hypothetical protein [Bacteroidota bacterium]MDP4237256.1 hypothetical protein [Bacteroidota bacterium]